MPQKGEQMLTIILAIFIIACAGVAVFFAVDTVRITRETARKREALFGWIDSWNGTLEDRREAFQRYQDVWCPERVRAAGDKSASVERGK